MGFAVREEPIDEEATKGEEKDKQRPEELVDRRAVRLDDLDWTAAWLAQWSFKARAWGTRHTKDDDIEDQHDETNNATTCSILPRIRLLGRYFVCDGSCDSEGSQAELGKEVGDESVLHRGGVRISLALGDNVLGFRMKSGLRVEIEHEGSLENRMGRWLVLLHNWA